MAMSHIERSIDVNAPLRVAYKQWTRFRGVSEIHE